MLIYIPKHLFEMEIIGQLSSLISSYNTYKQEHPEKEYPLYDTYRKYSEDPVKDFLRLVFKSHQGDNENILNYLTEKFYSAKGTLLVFEYMKRYLNLGLTEFYEPGYSCIINIPKINTQDLEVFKERLLGFLKDLLYWKDSPEGDEESIKISEVTLEVSGTLKVQVNLGYYLFNRINTTLV